MNEVIFDQVASELRENEDYLRNHHQRFRLTLGHLPSPAQPRPRVLDIGCWPGHLSLYLKKSGWDVDAIDLNPERIPKVTQAGIRVIPHNLNDHPQLPFPDNHFDSILFTEVFEHLNPASFPSLFLSIQQTLKSGGTLILTTPNRLALNKSLFIPNRWKHPEVDEEGHGHWKEYQLHEVLQTFAHTQLKTLRAETISFYSMLGRSNQTGYFPLAEWPQHPNKLRNLAKILINPIRNLRPFRDSLMIVAQKTTPFPTRPNASTVSS